MFALEANNNAKKAIPLLENIVDSNDLLFAQQARWYLALSYLQLDDTNKAVQIPGKRGQKTFAFDRIFNQKAK